MKTRNSGNERIYILYTLQLYIIYPSGGALQILTIVQFVYGLNFRTATCYSATRYQSHRIEIVSECLNENRRHHCILRYRSSFEAARMCVSVYVYNKCIDVLVCLKART